MAKWKSVIMMALCRIEFVARAESGRGVTRIRRSTVDCC